MPVAPRGPGLCCCAQRTPRLPRDRLETSPPRGSSGQCSELAPRALLAPPGARRPAPRARSHTHQTNNQSNAPDHPGPRSPVWSAAVSGAILACLGGRGTSTGRGTHWGNTGGNLGAVSGHGSGHRTTSKPKSDSCSETARARQPRGFPRRQNPTESKRVSTLLSSSSSAPSK